jgi:Sec-independent protein translocase protein TatA
VFAFIDNLGGTELLIVLVAALLVFGKRLPQVAGDAARQMAKLRRSLDEAWRDTGMEKEIQQVRRDLETAIPRDLSIADMARAASAEMDKRIRANEAEAKKLEAPPAEPPKELPPPSTNAGSETPANAGSVTPANGGPEKTSTLVDF